MNKKIILAVSSLFCIATFAVAQDTPQEAPAVEAAPVAAPAAEAAPVAAPAPVPAPAATEQPAPASVVAPAPNEPTAAPAAEQAAQNGESVPVIFYYANTTEAQQPTQPQPVVMPQPQPVAVAPVQQAPAPAPAPAPRVHPRQTMHYGILGSIGTSEYIGSSNDDLDDGLTWNAGAFITIPISDYIFSFELGSEFIYRKESKAYWDNDVDKARKDRILAYSLGFPIQMNINASRAGIVNFFVGTEIEVPLYNNLQVSFNGKKNADVNLQDEHCAPMSWDFIFGMGINATKHFGIYTRMNIGISDIYDDLYITDHDESYDNENSIYNSNKRKKEYWNFKPFDWSIGLRLFI
jgi:Predicted membrane protein